MTDVQVLRVKVDGAPCLIVNIAGEVRPVDVERLRFFAQQYLLPSVLDGDDDLVRVTGVDIDLVSIPAGPGRGRASVRLEFQQLEFQQTGRSWRGEAAVR